MVTEKKSSPPIAVVRSIRLVKPPLEAEIEFQIVGGSNRKAIFDWLFTTEVFELRPVYDAHEQLIKLELVPFVR